VTLGEDEGKGESPGGHTEGVGADLVSPIEPAGALGKRGGRKQSTIYLIFGGFNKAIVLASSRMLSLFHSPALR